MGEQRVSGWRNSRGKDVVVVLDVEGEMVFEPIGAFGGAPSSSKEAIDIGSKHGSGMVEAKKRVKAYFFKFPLACENANFLATVVR